MTRLFPSGLLRAGFAGALILLGAALARGTEDALETITIDNFSFTPGERVVAPGTRVVWTNRDDIPHAIVDADDPKTVKSPPLDTGEHFEHLFARAGTFHYFCSLHPHMRGTIVVR
jgi:plastocyanin